MPGDSQLQCIYCLEPKPAADFNREHVVPAAFGNFNSALVLGACVCESCNTYFGANLDLTLARGSDEGFQRYLWDSRPPEQIEQFKYDSVTFQYNGEGDYQGCLLHLTADLEDPNGFRATPIDQVGFARRDEDGFIWMGLDEVSEGTWRNRNDLNPQAGIKVYARDHESVRAYLEEQGASFPNWRQMVRDGESGDEAPVVQVAEFTRDLRRAVAKISFNYLAYTNGPQFALRPQFDVSRRFIRYGECGENLVDIDDESPIPLPPNTPDGHRPVVHVVTVERAVNTNAVIGQVLLCGGLRYQIVLSEQRADDLRASGHLYNVGDRCIYELVADRKRTPHEDTMKYHLQLEESEKEE